jgi:hypothetical protein
VESARWNGSSGGESEQNRAKRAIFLGHQMSGDEYATHVANGADEGVRTGLQDGIYAQEAEVRDTDLITRLASLG